jgi:predicted DNA-binding transcriptional regulator YafY
MTSTPTKLQRWLDIIAYLVGRRLPVSADELFRNVPAYAGRWSSDDRTQQESARRMFERDKDELRRLGIPILTVPYTMADHPERLEGYIIERRDFYLPYLKLVQEVSGRPKHSDPLRHNEVDVAESDAPLALEALRRVTHVPGFPLQHEARSAFRKLAFDIDPAVYAASPDAVYFVDRPGAAELTQTLRVLADARLARKRVRFGYHGIYRGERTERDVAGYGLMFQHGHWYLIGHDALRDDVRVFRVGRMSDVAANDTSPNTPDYAVPPDFRLDAYAGREAWELGERDEEAVVAHVHFRFPLSLWAERNGYGTVMARGTDGSQTRQFEVHQVNPFLRWVLGLEGEAALLEPAALREELRRMAREVANAHRSGR